MKKIHAVHSNELTTSYTMKHITIYIGKYLGGNIVKFVVSTHPRNGERRKSQMMSGGLGNENCRKYSAVILQRINCSHMK